MDSVEIPGDGGGAGDCNDGGVVGGGIGGDMGCEGDQSGGVGQFPGGDAERADQLGEELDESVGDFDEVLMEEQREIETVGRNTEGYGTGSGGRSGGNISLGEQAAGAQGGASGGAGGGGGGGGAGARSDPLEGMSEGEIEKRTPDDISVMMDDDIVAKQLREAALAEEDPELRERLWEEYRKYKGM
jgi:CubicO group peptidase (beta-lactamase class C family)